VIQFYDGGEGRIRATAEGVPRRYAVRQGEEKAVVGFGGGAAIGDGSIGPRIIPRLRGVIKG
jgi:hypothetical protein